MSILDQIISRALAAREMILHAAASLQHPGSRDLWLQPLDPWLRAGGSPRGGYLSVAPQSSLIRWHENTTSRHPWQFVHALVRQPVALASSDLSAWRRLRGLDDRKIARRRPSAVGAGASPWRTGQQRHPPETRQPDITSEPGTAPSVASLAGP